MPGTDNVTVWVAAQTGMVAAMSTKETNSFFMMYSLSVEKGQYIGKADCDQHERGYYPENQLVDGMNPGNRADFVRLARVCGPENASPREQQGYKRYSNEDRTIRTQRRHVANPGPTEAQRQTEGRVGKGSGR